MVKFITSQNPFGKLVGLNSLSAFLATAVTLTVSFFTILTIAAVNHSYSIPRVF